MGNTSGTDQGAGNPINVITGNKYQRETDMAALPGELGLEVVRHYNSLDRAPGSMGVGWRLSYDTEIVAGHDTVQVLEADGRRIIFTRDPKRRSLCVTHDPSNGSLQVVSNRGALAGFLWTWPNGRQLQFNSSGKLDSISDGHGNLLTLARDTRGELLGVTDPLGRTLRIHYADLGDRSLRVINEIDSPIGRISYTHAAEQGRPEIGNLLSVTLSDRHTIREYHYEKLHQNGNPHALTGISVRFAGETGKSQRLSTYAYRADGRAIWSMRGAGLDMVAVAQGPAGAVLVNSRGEHTSYAFAIIGGEHRLLSARGPGCQRCSEVNVRHTYDDSGRLESTDQTQYFRDGNGRIERIRAPSVISGRYHDVNLLYDDASPRPERPSARIERGYSDSGPIERRTEFKYDKWGRLEQDGDVRYVHDSKGRVVEKRESGSRITRYRYDALSRPDRIVQPDGTRIDYRYDPRGRVESIALNGRIEHYGYDAAERISRVVRPSGESLNYLYDAADRVSSIKDASGNVIAFDRDSEGLLVSRRFLDPYGHLEQRREDSASGASEDSDRLLMDAGRRAIGYVDDRGVHNGYTYDDFGRLTSSYTQDGGVTRFEYDAGDHLLRKRLPSGATVSFLYDDAGRVIERSNGTDTTVIRYGRNRRPSVVTFPGGEERYAYDAESRLTERVSRIGGAEYAIRYAYDANGALVKKELPGGQRLEFGYRRSPMRNAGLMESIALVDRNHRVVLVSGLNEARQGLSKRGFDLLGVTRFEQELDVEGRIIRIGASGLWQQDFSYTDVSGRLIESKIRSGDVIAAAAYRYDERRRLIGTASTGRRARAVGFSYDAGDNLIGVSGRTSVGYAIEAGKNRLLGAFRFNADGSLRDESGRHFDWDDDGQLRSISQDGRVVARYTYSALGERTQKTVFTNGHEKSTHYIYEQGKLVAEADERGRVVKQYVWLGDQPVAMIDGDRVLGIVADQIYTPRALFDRQHQLVSTSVTNVRGSNQYLDVESGLLYNGRRYLNPETGRYLSVDPLGVAGGSNPYTFASNDRIANVDLIGLQSRPALTQDQSINDWTLDQKLGFVFEEAAKQIADHELAAALRELVSPQALATTAIIFSTWAASQFTPYGWVGDIALTGIGALFLGKSIWDVIETTFSVARGLAVAKCQSDLQDVSTVLAHGLSQAAAALVAASAAGATSGSVRIARLLRTIFKRDVGAVKRSRLQAAINQSRFGIFNPSRGSYAGRIANREWMELQRANGRSDAHPPWDPRRAVVDTWLNPGDKIYIIQIRGFPPGGWATTKRYSSLAEARRELSILEEFKRSNYDLVIQEYSVKVAIPVRSGYSGPQVSGWPASESYVGGGSQLQLLVDTSGTQWRQYLTLDQTLELKK